MATKGLGSPAKRPVPSWWISDVLPCMRWGAATISAPKAWPMHWWPRQTPSSGTSPASSADGLEADAPVLGAARTGRDQHGVGPLGPDAGDVDGVVAEDDRVRAELAQLLDEVVDEGVVVVDDEDPGAHGWPIVPGPGRLANLCPRGHEYQGTGRRLAQGQVRGRAHRDVEGGSVQDGRGERALHRAHPQERASQPAVVRGAHPGAAHRRGGRHHGQLPRPACRSWSTAHPGAWSSAS